MKDPFLTGCVKHPRSYSTFIEDLLVSKIDLSKITYLHSDELQKIDYEFGKEIRYFPEFKLDEMDFDKNNTNLKNWQYNLQWLIENKFKEDVVYSLAVLGLARVEGKWEFTTFGPHLLVTKDINIERLIIYIEGQIESSVFNLESPTVFDVEKENISDNAIILFRYRDITNRSEVRKRVKEIDYNEKNREDKINLNRIKDTF